jgi:hypothetical protein
MESEVQGSEEIYIYEEKIWHKRCSEKWVLKRDTNPRFFSCAANDKRRKCDIFSLETEDGEISELGKLREHIEGYYKQLFGKECRGALRLEEDFWVATRSLSEQETA